VNGNLRGNRLTEYCMTICYDRSGRFIATRFNSKNPQSDNPPSM
jgi:hypothetical protein